MVTQKLWQKAILGETQPTMTKTHNTLCDSKFVLCKQGVALPPPIINVNKEKDILSQYKTQIAAIGVGKYVIDFFLKY
jgi:hypothetical protein